MRKRALVEVYAQAIGPPFNATASAPGFGARIGAFFPPWGGCIADWLLGSGCLHGNIALGYTPAPRFVVFELQTGYPFY